jgi:hypothetical protein
LESRRSVEHALGLAKVLGEEGLALLTGEGATRYSLVSTLLRELPLHHARLDHALHPEAAVLPELHVVTHMGRNPRWRLSCSVAGIAPRSTTWTVTSKSLKNTERLPMRISASAGAEPKRTRPAKAQTTRMKRELRGQEIDVATTGPL